MRIKRKNKKKSVYITIIAAVVLLFMTVGYGLFSEKLRVQGIVKTNYLIQGTKLNLKLIKNGNYYSTGTFPSRANLQSEVLNDNILTITFNKTDNNVLFYTTTLNLTFENIYNEPLSKGKINHKVTSGGGFSVMSSKLDKKDLAPGERGTLTMKYNYINYNSPNPSTLTVTLEYTVKGLKQTFEYVIVMTR